MHCAQ
ncbi:23S rRNA (uracil-5-)-methyltransferase RumA, partial [Yersinia pestis PY-92]